MVHEYVLNRSIKSAIESVHEHEDQDQAEVRRLQEEKDLTCFCCNAKIEEDADYYKCQFHGNVFCYSCTFNPLEGSIGGKFIKPAKCKQIGKNKINCIWQKKHKPFETWEKELKAKGHPYQVI